MSIDIGFTIIQKRSRADSLITWAEAKRADEEREQQEQEEEPPPGS
jgi:hypothetical protein